jgi:hypothetical protein
VMATNRRSSNIFEFMLNYPRDSEVAVIEADLNATHITIFQDLRYRLRWTFVELQAFFISVRHLIEIRNLKSQFQVTNFYCNWFAHDSLFQSAFGYQILERFNDFLLEIYTATGDSAPNADEAQYREAITHIFSIGDLCTELIAIFDLYGIDHLPVFSPAFRPALSDMTFHYLHGKSTAFSNNVQNPDDNTDALFTRISKAYEAVSRADLIVREVTIFKLEGVPNIRLRFRSGMVLVLQGYFRN